MSWRTERFKSFVENFLLVVFAALLVRVFVVSPYRVPNNLMSPQLQTGDILMGYRLPLGLRLPFMEEKWFAGEPELGQVVVYRSQDFFRRPYVRRVVALGGDRVEIRQGLLFVNGVLSPSNFAGAQSEAFSLPSSFVPQGHVMVLADQRLSKLSEESQTPLWKFVPADAVEAQILGLWVSFDWKSEKPFPSWRPDRTLSFLDSP